MKGDTRSLDYSSYGPVMKALGRFHGSDISGPQGEGPTLGPPLRLGEPMVPRPSILKPGLWSLSGAETIVEVLWTSQVYSLNPKP